MNVDITRDDKDPSDTELFEVLVDSDIPAADLESERRTANAILDRAETATNSPSQISLKDVGRITPWVAKQLGRFTDGVSKEDQQMAIEYGILAVRVAQECGHAPTLCDNLITLGNVLRINNRFSESEAAYFSVLKVSSADCLVKRGVAHMSLSQLYETTEHVRKAGHHMEMAICCFGKSFPPASLAKLQEKLGYLFRDTKQLGGILHVLSYHAKGDFASIMTSEQVKSIELDMAIAAVTTLHKLENHETAELFMNSWLMVHSLEE